MSMTKVVLIVAGVLISILTVYYVFKVRGKRNSNGELPDDIYPLW
jgi:hypothetical protein